MMYYRADMLKEAGMGVPKTWDEYLNVAKTLNGKDMDGDGTSDILWHDSSTGANVIWRSADSTTQQAVTQMPDLAWKIVGTGDYDGDSKRDFVVQRNNGGGQARFWMLQTNAGFSSVVFGTPTDVVVPGD